VNRTTRWLEGGAGARLLVLIGEAFAAFALTSLALSVDSPAASLLVIVAAIILVVVAVAFAGSYLASLAAQGLNPRLPLLAVRESWWGFQSFAAVCALTVAIFMPADSLMALILLAAGFALIVIAATSRGPTS
jgi:hypothetical protein